MRRCEAPRLVGASSIFGIAGRTSLLPAPKAPGGSSSSLPCLLPSPTWAPLQKIFRFIQTRRQFFIYFFLIPSLGTFSCLKQGANRCRVSKVSFSHLSDRSLPLRSSWDSSGLEGCFLPVSSAGASVYLGPQMLCLGLRCCPFSLDTPFEAYIPADVSQISVHSSELSPELVADNSNAN